VGSCPYSHGKDKAGLDFDLILFSSSQTMAVQRRRGNVLTLVILGIIGCFMIYRPNSVVTGGIGHTKKNSAGNIMNDNIHYSKGNLNLEPSVHLVRSDGAPKQCAHIAEKSGLSDVDLFYLNFDNVGAPLVPSNLMTEWVDSGCLGTFLSTWYLGNTGDISKKMEAEMRSKISSLKKGERESGGKVGGFDMSPIAPPVATVSDFMLPSTPRTKKKGHLTEFGRHWAEIQTEPILHPSDFDDGVPKAIAFPKDLQAAYKVTPRGESCPTGVIKCCALEADKNYWGRGIRNPLLAIATGVTSRMLKKRQRHVKHMGLFTKLLPSFSRTYDCDVDYLIVVAFDEGDIFYDTEEGQDEMNAWLIENMAKPMALAGVRINFLLVRVSNFMEKPGPAFNAMLKDAYKAGADYFYRVNDDTELKGAKGGNGESGWSKAFVGALNSLKPPYGIAGPFHGQGNVDILTHDFAHRMHMDIFKGVYYDPIYTDWWMDDYISLLYGRERTLRSTHFEAVHHVGHHGGSRYEVGDDKKAKLVGSITRGREEITDWMEKHGWGVEETQKFKGDEQGPPYEDFPCGDWTGLPCGA